jgi:hypothetical protein
VTSPLTRPPGTAASIKQCSICKCMKSSHDFSNAQYVWCSLLPVHLRVCMRACARACVIAGLSHRVCVCLVPVGTG